MIAPRSEKADASTSLTATLHALFEDYLDLRSTYHDLYQHAAHSLPMTTLNASNLTLDDVHRLFGFQGQYNGSFTPLLSLEPITEVEQQELMLAYAYKSLEYQDSVWGLATNGLNYQFAYMQSGNPPIYQLMPLLNLFEFESSIRLLQVLKATAN
ncbi:MAG TPA: hypothetical protein V6D50_20380 [Chroococcales cyanobacterium]